MLKSIEERAMYTITNEYDNFIDAHSILSTGTQAQKLELFERAKGRCMRLFEGRPLSDKDAELKAQIIKTTFEKARLPKLKYCQHKVSNASHCAHVATHSVRLASRKEKDNSIINETIDAYRCEQHKTKGTNSKRVVDSNAFDQSKNVKEVIDYLKSLVGKNIKAKVHTAKQLNVSYVKEDVAGIMCFQPITKKWKFVYYNQIEEVYENTIKT